MNDSGISIPAYGICKASRNKMVCLSIVFCALYPNKHLSLFKKRCVTCVGVGLASDDAPQCGNAASSTSHHRLSFIRTTTCAAIDTPRNCTMPPDFDDDVDYFGDFDSADEAELIGLADENSLPSGNAKRKSTFESDAPLPKRPAVDISSIPASALTALTRNFGLKAFRLKQEQAISRILGGGSAVVIFPTGGGKSLCYQVPALCFEEEDKLNKARSEGEHGVTLVVSPLIALMKDQVDSLVKRGIRAAAMDSSQSREGYVRFSVISFLIPVCF